MTHDTSGVGIGRLFPMNYDDARALPQDPLDRQGPLNR